MDDASRPVFIPVGSNPARLFGLYPAKGHLNPGADADIVLFDPAEIRDHATYDDPQQFATGVQAVFINERGQIVADGVDRTTGTRAAYLLTPTYRAPALP
mgnify:CR=1 FL=1